MLTLLFAKQPSILWREPGLFAAEKIKEVLEFIDSFLVEKGGDEVIVNWDGRTPRDLLKLIKRDLEK